MKLYHLGIWIFTMPALAASIESLTSGVIYVKASIVVIPCQPLVITQLDTHSIYSQTGQFNVSVAHCQSWLPFTLTLDSKKHVLTNPPQDSSVLLPISPNHPKSLLEIHYD